MKVVILAGGLGTRLSEETSTRPKPMVEIGGMPIIWHIMKIYSSFGLTDFIICCGYKGYIIKEYFANYFHHTSDLTFNLKDNSVFVHNQRAEPWSITLVDTGEITMTGGRLKRVSKYLKEDESFCFTYGDGVANVDVTDLIEFHRAHELEATVTAVHPPPRFGALSVEPDGLVSGFSEKPHDDGGLINGGFFVLNTSVLSRIKSDKSVWEEEPLRQLAIDGQLAAYRHTGFWQPMDTLRDKLHLDELWSSGSAPWKTWD